MANRLFIGNRRYSSWSMRGWLAVQRAGLDVEDVVIPLGQESTPALAGLTPTGLVPALEHDGIIVWDSLAICEYCAEIRPDMWPADRGPRSFARSAAAEMHAGFHALRASLPMNLGRLAAAPKAPAAPQVAADIARIEELWRLCMGWQSGPYLFGTRFGVADVMFAPVVARFLSYAPALRPASQAYCAAIRAHPLVDRWYALAAAEPPAWQLAKYEEK